MTSSRNPPDDFGDVSSLGQARDDPGSSTALHAAGIQTSPPDTREPGHGASDADAVVWIFEALTGRSATAVERVSLLKPPDA